MKDIIAAVSETSLRLRKALEDGRISTSQSVHEYLHSSTGELITSTMIGALNTKLPDLLKKICDRSCTDFSDSYALVANQGVYAAIVHSAQRGVHAYVGSSYGQQGLRNRILKNHLNALYRSQNSLKALYQAMDAPGSTTFFVCLLRYDHVVPIGQVLLAEATCASLFGTFDSEIYRTIRHESLPKVRWDYGLNRSDPLRLLPTGPETIGNDVTTYRRLRTLENCLDGGPVRVGFHSRRGHANNGSYQFCLFNENFTIPKDVALSWKLGKEDEVNIQWECTQDRHPHAFAPLAEEVDVGKGVGIRVSKLIAGSPQEHWTLRRSRAAVLLANTLYDFLTGRIVGKEYEWTDSRRYIFQEREDHKDAGGEIFGRRERLGIPYINQEFEWDDKRRRPETKPAHQTKVLPARKTCTSSSDFQKPGTGVDQKLSKLRCTQKKQTEDNRQDKCGTNQINKPKTKSILARYPV